MQGECHVRKEAYQKASHSPRVAIHPRGSIASMLEYSISWKSLRSKPPARLVDICRRGSASPEYIHSHNNG